MTDFDTLPDAYPDAQGPTLTGAAGRKCARHDWRAAIHGEWTGSDSFHATAVVWKCARCGVIRDEVKARRGRQSRNYGNRAELSASRKYGGDKIGAAGGPVDIRGKDWNVQVKTHRRLPPREWTKAFAALEASGERLPRLLLRFLPGPGLPPVDYFVVPGKAWLDWYGRDE